jgi:hypothetical protein
MLTKPKLFIASSREARPLARAIQQNLEEYAFVTVWDQNAIHPGENVIDGLIRNCVESQFGVFVLSPDDKATVRTENLDIVRDNVIFELGMFMGRLGKEKSFIIRPDRPVGLHLPEDLRGISFERYDSSRIDNLRATLAPCCERIANAMDRQTVSQLSSEEEFLNSVVKFSLETVCRAMGVPSTPEQASLRLFIFRKEGEELVCRHYWDPNPSDEEVGVTRFAIDDETAKDAIVVRCYQKERSQRTEWSENEQSESHGDEVSGREIKGSAGKIKDDLKYVLAAPIRDKHGSIWGVVDFDASNEKGQALLQTELAGTVMLSLIRQLRFILLRS